MNGAAVNWLLGAALATVACVAGRRLVSSRARRPQAAIHLAMALGMAALLAPSPGPLPESVLRIGFGALAVVLGLDRIRLLLNVPGAGRFAAPGVHRLHHAAMSGIMTLMAAPAGAGAAPVAGPGMAVSGKTGSGMTGSGVTVSGMVMPGAAGGSSPVLLAAFGYACVFALVFAWRLPFLAPASEQRGGADPLGHACEVTMLVSTAVMLLSML